MKKNFLNKILFLSSMTALYLFLAVILTGLAESIINSQQIIHLDKYLADLFLSCRNGFGVSILSVITFLANLEFALPLFFLIWLFLVIKKQKTFIWPFVFTVFSAEMITLIGKIYIQRVRPENGVFELLDFSFPSGHSTIALTLYGFLAYFLIVKSKERFVKLIILFSALLFILLVGYSRLYLGFHYFSDVIAGYLISLAALLAGISWQLIKTGNSGRV